MRDFKSDWHRWSSAERLVAATFAMVWLGAATTCLASILAA